MTLAGRRPALRALVVALSLLAAGPGAAGIRTDGTVGPRSAELSGAMTIGEGLGRRAGTNLFHSFEHFDIATGETATFTGSADIANVISRVTGGAASGIDGTLRSQVGHASFFLINPAGVVFGPNATVDVPGAFHVSTADRLNFPDGYYSATDTAGSTFSMAAPESFGFLAHQAPADIRVSGSQLAFKPGQALSLVGGNVSVTADPDTYSFAVIESRGGEVRVVAVGAPDGENRIAVRDGSSTLVPRGRVEVSEGSTIDVSNSEPPGGPASILLRGGTVAVSSASALYAQHELDTDSAGVIRVDADAITITDSQIDASNFGNGRGNTVALEAGSSLKVTGSSVAANTWGDSPAAAALRLSGADIELNNSVINVSNVGAGRGGTVALEAGNSLQFTGSNIAVDNWGDGPKAAALRLSGADILVANSVIGSSVYGSGPGADIRVTAGSLTIDAATAADGLARVTTRVKEGATGTAGDIDIDAQRITLSHGGQITSTVEPGALGAGGNLGLTVSESLAVSGAVGVDTETRYSGIGTTAQSQFALCGGDIAIQAPNAALRLADGGFIQSGTAGAGRSGDIRIVARSFAADAGSSLQAVSAGTGAAGDLTITVGESMTLSGASIASWSDGVGAAGNITIDVGRDLSLMQSSLDASTLTAGAAGHLAIGVGGSFIMGGGSWLDTATYGGGAAGDIDVHAGADIRLSDLASMGAATGGSGAAGVIAVTAGGAVQLTNGAYLFANSEAMTDAVGTYIDTRLGDAGRITIDAGALTLSDSSLVVSSNNRANAGAITVTVTGDILIDTTLIPTETAVASGLLAGNTRPLTAAPMDPTRLTLEGRSGSVRLTATDILLANRARIDIGTTAGDGGSVAIEARTLGLLHGASIRAVTGAAGAAGGIAVQAKGDILMSDKAFMSAATSGQGRSGAIVLGADGAMMLGNGSYLFTSTTGPGAAGNLRIDVGGSFAMFADSWLNTSTSAGGAAGDIRITAGGDIRMVGDAYMSAETTGQGHSGAIALRADGNLELTDGSYLVAATTGPGAAGDVTLTVGKTLTLDGGATIESWSLGAGAAGNLMIGVGGAFVMGADTWLATLAGAGGEARAGDIRLTVGGAMTLGSEASIESWSAGASAAGDLTIDLGGSLVMDTGAWLDTSASAGGAAGTIGVQADGDIRVRNGAYMSASTLGRGRAGAIELVAGGAVELTDAAYLFAESGAARDAAGNDLDTRLGEAGRITLDAASVTLRHAGLSVVSSNLAGAGVIDLRARADIRIEGVTGLLDGLQAQNQRPVTAALVDPTQVAQAGRAGTVALRAPRISLGQGSLIDISTTAGDGGLVSIDAGSLSLGGGVLINAFTRANGAAGNIAIQTTGDLLMRDGASIWASTVGQGRAGTITLNVGGILELTNGSHLIAFSGALADAAGNDLDTRLGDAGRITVAAGALTLRDSGLWVTSSNRANAGAIDLSVRGTLLIDGTTGAPDGLWAANMRPITAPPLDPTRVAAEGRSGTVSLQAAVVTLAHGAIVDISSSAGNGGSVTVTSGALNILNGGTIWAIPTGTGRGGDVRVCADAAVLIEGRNPWVPRMKAGITTANADSPTPLGFVGAAGAIDIAAETLTIGYGGLIDSSSFADAGSAAGAVTLNLGRLDIRDGGAILSGTTGAGAAGDIRIDARQSVVVRGTGEDPSAIAATTASPFAGVDQGRGGNVRISAPEVLIEQGGEVQSATYGNAAAGTVTLRADRLIIRSGGEINTDTFGWLGSGRAGSIDIEARFVALDGSGAEALPEPWQETGILSRSDLGGSAGGTVRVQATQRLDLSNGAFLSTSTVSAGDAGAITVSAGTLTIDHALLASRAESGATGFVGNIDVTAGLLDLRNLGEISIAANQNVPLERLASAPDNRIRIAATDLRLTTGGTISAESTGNARAGAIEISGQHLSAGSGAAIQSDAAGSGAAGRIRLQVAAIDLEGAEVRAATSGSGAGGALGITGQTLSAVNGARVRTDTSGSGAAGRVDLSLGGLLALAPGTELSTSTSAGGDAGRIGVTAGSIDLNHAALTSRAEPGASGQAGAIVVSAGAIDLRNAAQISSASNQGATAGRPAAGAAGQISISAAALRLDGASGITAASTGSVPAGSIRIVAGALSLAGQSRITTESVNADGGAIDISARSLWLTDSQITTSVLGAAGSGGDISIRTGLLGLNGGFIQANTAAAGAAGGDLTILADRVIASHGFIQVGGNERLAFRPGSGLNVIQAAAPAGVQGNITTTVPPLDVTKGLAALEVPVGDPAALVRDRCLVGSARVGSSLVELPVAGLPAAPAAPAAVSFAGERLDRLLADGG